jgi:hypothetical protein
MTKTVGHGAVGVQPAPHVRATVVVVACELRNSTTTPRIAEVIHHT